MTKTFALIEEEIEVEDYDKKIVELKQVEKVVSINEILDKIVFKNNLINSLQERINEYLADVAELENDIKDIKSSTGIK